MSLTKYLAGAVLSTLIISGSALADTNGQTYQCPSTAMVAQAIQAGETQITYMGLTYQLDTSNGKVGANAKFTSASLVNYGATASCLYTNPDQQTSRAYVAGNKFVPENASDWGALYPGFMQCYHDQATCAFKEMG